jgi:hypothetical protein
VVECMTGAADAQLARHLARSVGAENEGCRYCKREVPIHCLLD